LNSKGAVSFDSAQGCELAALSPLARSVITLVISHVQRPFEGCRSGCRKYATGCKSSGRAVNGQNHPSRSRPWHDGRHGRRNGKGFFDYSEDGKSKTLWPDLSELATPTLTDAFSDKVKDELKKRIPYRKRTWARFWALASPDGQADRSP